MTGRYRRPVTPAEREKAAAARQEKLTALHERLREQVQTIANGPQWRRWLDVAGKFRTYSFNNTLLIAAQKPDATMVAGYTVWQQLGRQVSKGEKGIMIFAPVMRRTPPDGEVPYEPDITADPPAQAAGGRRLAGFTAAYVWDVSQTHGDPLPDPPAMPVLLAGRAPPGLWDALAGEISRRGYTLTRGQPATAGAHGSTNFAARTVTVRADVDDAQAVKTLAHELAHVLMHDPSQFDGGQTGRCRGDAEVEAESVAYLVAAEHGLDTSDYTFAYVAHWAADRDVAQLMAATGPRIMNTTTAVLDVTRPAQSDEVEAAPQTAALTQLTDRVENAAAGLHALRADAETAVQAAQPAAADETVDLDELSRVHNDAAAFYAGQYPDSWAPRYVEQRIGENLTGDTRWQLGYAPAGWTALTDHLRGRGYDDQTILDAGLGRRARTGNVIDLFRDRLMFPIRDETGQVVGFIGRRNPVTDEVEVTDLTGSYLNPKYLNSPDTALFTKGRQLYGLPEARDYLDHHAMAVLVEGPLDTIAVTTGTGGRAVGLSPLGVALTPVQARQLGEAIDLADRDVVIALDADPAGRAAAERAFYLLAERRADPREARLPEGMDPAELQLMHGPAALLDALLAGDPMAWRLIEAVIARHRDPWEWTETRLAAARDAAEVVGAMAPNVWPREITRLAARLELGVMTIQNEILEVSDRADDAWGRLAARHTRDDLDRGQTVPRTPAELARDAYPKPFTRVTAPQTTQRSLEAAAAATTKRTHAAGRQYRS